MSDDQLRYPQLEEIKAQLDAASRRAVSIFHAIDSERLKQRPQPDGWSIAECIVHLNLSSRAEIDALNDVRSGLPNERMPVEKRFKMDLLGKFLKWTLEPPPMFFSKMKTTDVFQPTAIEPVEQALPEFLAWQERLKTCVDQVNGLPLDRIKVVSPFNRKVKYNLFSFFHILLAHERRHLHQAEKVRAAIG